jgi:periplasmic divalent cation tolerance protein
VGQGRKFSRGRGEENCRAGGLSLRLTIVRLFRPIISKEESIMDSQPLVVYCTCPDQATAEHIAETVVDERLAACVNLVPGLISIYRWQGQIQRDAEWLLIIKTYSTVYSLLEARLCELHPYKIPEIIALPIQAGSADYLDWMVDSTGVPV